MEIDIIQGIQRAGSVHHLAGRIDKGDFDWLDDRKPQRHRFKGQFPLGSLQCAGNLRPHQRLGARHRRAHLGFVLLAHGVNHGGSTDNRGAVSIPIMTARICPRMDLFRQRPP